MKYQAAIFDMDNVLIDSEKLWPKIDQAFFCEYLGDAGWHKWQPVWLKMKKEMVQLKEIMAALKEMFDKQETPEQIMNLRMSKMFEIYRKELHIMPGVEKVLRMLKEKKFKMAIASGMNMKIIEFVVGLFGWQDYFSALASTHEVKKNKPDPEIFLLAASRLGIEPKKCLAFENDLNGVKAAAAAGLCTVAIPYPQINVDEMKKKAKFSLNSLVEFRLD